MRRFCRVEAFFPSFTASERRWRRYHPSHQRSSQRAQMFTFFVWLQVRHEAAWSNHGITFKAELWWWSCRPTATGGIVRGIWRLKGVFSNLSWWKMCSYWPKRLHFRLKCCRAEPLKLHLQGSCWVCDVYVEHCEAAAGGQMNQHDVPDIQHSFHYLNTLPPFL